MLQQRDIFFTSAEEGIGICGLYIAPRDSFHVGVYCNWQGEQQVIHFAQTNTILIQNIIDVNLQPYYFVQLKDFPREYVDTLLGLIDAIAKNPPQNLYLNISEVIYNGGMFTPAAEYQTNTATKALINCAVFVLSILQTCEYSMLDWASWPSLDPNIPNPYLEDWMNFFNIPIPDRDAYYNFSKEIRGKHVMGGAIAGQHPVGFNEANVLSEVVLNHARKDHGII